MLNNCALLALVSCVSASAATYSDVAPIIAKHCVPCHRPGGNGPFSLLTYDGAKRHARQIAAVTQSRYMPPWLPAGPRDVFENDLRLNASEIKLITNWVAAGAPGGEEASRLSDPTPVSAPDLLLQAAQPFTVPASGSDVFWNFVFTPKIQKPVYVRAIQIEPGTRAAHHANVALDRIGGLPGDGFPGMDVEVDRNPFDPDSHFLFWKPGGTPHLEPEGMTWQLNPGNQLVLNIHLQPTGKPEIVRPSIALYFSDAVPRKHPILVEMQADDALNIPPGASNFAVSDKFILPVDCDLLAIYPHTHYLGKRLQADVLLADGSTKELILIPEWNLNWQSVYYYREPVFLPKGSTVRMRFTYDNSAANVRNPNHPPKRVVAGNLASDEMAHLWLQLLPRGPGDRRRAIQEAVAEHRLERNPQDGAAFLLLGAVRMTRLDTQGAESAFRRAVALRPKDAQAHDMLGAVLRSLGEQTAAEREFETALKLNSALIDARYNLARLQAARGDLSEALENMRAVASAYPNVSRFQDELRQLQTSEKH